MTTKSTHGRVLHVPMLKLEWDRRLIDGLVYGLSRLSVPMSGGSERMWEHLVSDLQGSSTSDSTACDAFHLIAADRRASGSTLELGVHTGYCDALLLHTRLDLAVSRANRSAAPSARPAPGVATPSGVAASILA